VEISQYPVELQCIICSNTAILLAVGFVISLDIVISHQLKRRVTDVVKALK